MTRRLCVDIYKLPILRRHRDTGRANVVIKRERTGAGSALGGFRLYLLPARLRVVQQRVNSIYNHPGSQQPKRDGENETKRKMTFAQLRFDDRPYRRFFFSISTTHTGILSMRTIYAQRMIMTKLHSALLFSILKRCIHLDFAQNQSKISASLIIHIFPRKVKPMPRGYCK